MAEGVFAGDRVILLKPLTFMNLSGNAVAPLARRKGIEPSDVMVVSDDIYLPLGRLRFRPSGGDGGHKGLRSIKERLGNDDFARLRIGIDPLEADIDDLTEFVLRRLHPSHQCLLGKVADLAVEGLETYLRKGMAVVMERYNGCKVKLEGSDKEV